MVIRVEERRNDLGVRCEVLQERQRSNDLSGHHQHPPKKSWMRFNRPFTNTLSRVCWRWKKIPPNGVKKPGQESYRLRVGITEFYTRLTIE